MQMTIINAKGLHARASAKFAETCEGFSADVQVTYEGMQVDGRSIMGLMMLGAAKGAKIEVQATGSDSETCLNALDELLKNYFGEGG